MAEHVYEKDDRKMSDIELIKKTWPYIKPYAWKIVGVLLLMIIMIMFDILANILPGYVTSSIGNLVVNFSDHSIQMSDMKPVFVVIGAFLVVNVINSGFVYITRMCLQHIGQSIIYDLRMIVFEHIYNM